MLWLALLSAGLGVGCEPPNGTTVQDNASMPGTGRVIAAPAVVQRFPLPVPAAADATLDTDPWNRLWVGRRGELLGLDATTGSQLLRIPLEEDAVPHVIGATEDRFYVRAGDQLLVLTADTGEVRTQREVSRTDIIRVDPLGRHLYLATETGAVLGLYPRTLRPSWAWARLGQPAAAAAVSPEGDRLYLVLRGPPGSDAAVRILVRDVQTGRVLQEVSFDHPIRDLTADSRGRLYGIMGEQEEESVFAMQPGPEGPRLLWTREVRELQLQAPVRIRVSPVGDRIAVLVAGAAGTLQVLDSRTGRSVGAPHEGVLAASFGEDGSLYLLLPTEIQVLR